VSLGAQQVMQCAWNPPGLTIFELHLLGSAAGSGVVTHQTGSMRLVPCALEAMPVTAPGWDRAAKAPKTTCGKASSPGCLFHSQS